MEEVLFDVWRMKSQHTTDSGIVYKIFESTITA